MISSTESVTDARGCRMPPQWYLFLLCVTSLAGGCVAGPDRAGPSPSGEFLPLKLGIEAFRSSQGRLPRCITELQDASFPQRYVPVGGFEDRWGHEIKYSTREDEYELRSAGSDGEFGTEDDLVYVPSVWRSRFAEFAGCYQISQAGGKPFIATWMLLHQTGRVTGDWPRNSFVSWTPVGDSIEIRWQYGPHGGSSVRSIHLRATADSLWGSVDSSRIRAVRGPCS